MMELTIEEYMMKTREDYGSRVARPKFDKDTRFKLKGQFLKELREHTFSGSENKDANEHIERVHGTIFIYSQMRCLKSAADAKKVIQEVGRHLKKHTTLSLEYNSHKQEDAAIRNQGASIKALEIQIGKMSKVLQERGSRSLPSSTKTHPRDHVKSITNTEEAKTLKEDDKMPLIELIQETITFPGHLKENGFDEKGVLKELKMLKVNSTESATSLRGLLMEKSRIEKEFNTTMKVHFSTILKDALPQKKNMF
ncbi:hypothetical protein Tco_0756946 [Tanacetum coccineum]